MYLDYILFAVGGCLALAALLLAAYLLRSRKKSEDYRRILREATEHTDLMTTLRATQATAGAEREATQPLTVQATQPLTEGPEPAEWETAAGLDTAPLEGKYILLEEIHGGGMSRIFKARHATLGNEWIVKYVDGRDSSLAAEADILKQLNHISLPQIIDVLPNATGTFLVERYIEGYPLSQVIASGERLGQGLICDWCEQMAQVLQYLHGLEKPIIHCDLKPSNIMVTHDNRLVLIDFGISRQQGRAGGAAGVTYGYAAPEQFGQKLSSVGQKALEARFGSLPEAHMGWKPDQRTDLYSLGVILYELAVGRIPLKGDGGAIYERVYPDLGKVILTCMEVDPARRYQSAGELLQAVQRVKGAQLHMARSLTLRRVAVVAAIVTLLGSGSTTAAAAYVNQQEALALLTMSPAGVVVTAQQTAKLLIEKQYPPSLLHSGEPNYLDPSELHWSYPEENVVRVEGDQIVGLNPGQTTVVGRYRNKLISLDVTVVEPPREQVAVSLRYSGMTRTAVLAGSGLRDRIDGPYGAAAFVSPERVEVLEDGGVVLTDAGVLRILRGGETSTLDFEPTFLTAALVRSRGEDLYVLTDAWEDGEGSYYGILALEPGAPRFLWYTDAAYSTVRDLRFGPDGLLWFILENLGTGETNLNTLDPESGESAYVLTLPESTSSLDFDRAGNLYLSVPDDGVILRLDPGAENYTYFVGVSGERAFLDGNLTYLYQPMRLKAAGDSLYVLDYDVVRRITIEGDGALYSETLAGFPNPDSRNEAVLGPGYETAFPASALADLTLDGAGRVLLTSPKESCVYVIETEHADL